MTSHTWGLAPLSAGSGYIRGEINHKQQLSSHFSWNAGIDLAGSTKHAFNTIWLQQIYAEATWRKWNLRVGPKQSYTSFLDERLSSGDFILSNNARPIPEINLSLKDFVAVPYTKDKLYLRGDIAFGKMLDGDYVESIAKPANRNYYKGITSHHKSVYFRFGNFEKNDNFRLTFGLQHFAYFDGHGIIDGVENKSRNSFAETLRTIFIAKEGGPDGAGEYKYKTGSHVGAYTVKLGYKSKNKDVFSIYWHHFIEDGSSAGPQSIRDMLAGLEYRSNKKQPISGAVIEYIYTKDQSGPVHFNYGMDDKHQNLVSKGNGMDDYYNNVQYIQGPSYYGRSFGTPLFLSPEYNTDGTVNFKSNRIIAYHGAVEGYLSKTLSYRARATYGETWGRYKVPYLTIRKGFAYSIDLTYHSPKTGGLDFKCVVALNNGSFFDDNTLGTGISIIKHGIISKKQALKKTMK
jgi:Capsule assembly protein Wzi